MATPFKVHVEDSEIQLLKDKLSVTRFPDELTDAGWAYGVPLADMKRLVNYWRDGYNWRQEEERINRLLPQFTIDVDLEDHGSLNIHFVHQKSEVKGAIPLLIVHGWPGHFLEVIKILPLLTRPDDKSAPSFHVVALGLPGYGFSEGSKAKGFDIYKYAEVGHKLMLSLGYDEYVAQGGDWGTSIGSAIARNYGPKHCKAVHRSMIVARPPTVMQNPLLWIQDKVTPYSAFEKGRLMKMLAFTKTGFGYAAEQSTQPQTLGYSLADSPAGLLGWIYEKLHTWTDSYPWSDDEILTWVSLFWFSRAGPAASLRIYYEHSQKRSIHDFHTPVNNVALGLSNFVNDIVYGRGLWRKALGNKIVFEREHHSGGHFAAYEVPEVLAKDLRDMFGKTGPAFGVVNNCSGYSNSGERAEQRARL